MIQGIFIISDGRFGDWARWILFSLGFGLEQWSSQFQSAWSACTLRSYWWSQNHIPSCSGFIVSFWVDKVQVLDGKINVGWLSLESIYRPTRKCWWNPRVWRFIQSSSLPWQIRTSRICIHPHPWKANQCLSQQHYIWYVYAQRLCHQYRVLSRQQRFGIQKSLNSFLYDNRIDLLRKNRNIDNQKLDQFRRDI